MDIRTRYVRNRLAETPYERRKYIYDLIQIEEWINRRADGLASSLLLHHLRRTYPVDCRFIAREINEGHVASAAEVKKAFDDQAACEREEKMKEEMARSEKEVALREAWLKARGKR